MKHKIPNVISLYMHCARCLKETPPNQAPKDYQRIQVGITEDLNLQIWCTRHDMEVGFFVLTQEEKEKYRNVVCQGDH